MRTRPATGADLPAITALQRAVDTHWFGAPESDESEVAERFSLAASGHRLVVEDDRGALVGAGWWHGSDTTLLDDPAAADRLAVLGALLDRFTAHGVVQVECLSTDDVLREELVRRGWRHAHSSFELVRAVSVDWTLDEPRWPAGIDLTAATADELPALHRLVYTDARWTDVEGHVARPFDEWCAIFTPSAADVAGHVVARRDGRPVGLALRRIFSDGTGWLPQLAVSVDARRLGLGRALLLEALRRHRDQGATSLGLGVQAANAGALELYLGVGLRIDREYRSFVAS